MAKAVPIPGPKGVPFLGNIYDVESELPTRSLELMADNYGTNELWQGSIANRTN
jgi:cytochrome P450/NADPH-cytochrome P450 reductase